MSTQAIESIRKTLRVLMIEDYEEDALLLQRHLGRAGYAVQALRVETADQLRDALVDPEAWDLAIADYTLPSFGARDALAMIQQSGAEMPFIIVSGTIDEVSAVNAMRAGAHDYVLKGHLERLLPAIERELSDAERRRDRLRTESELRLLQQRFSATFNQAAVGMAHTSVDGAFVLVNQRLTEMLDLPAEKLASLRWEDFLLPSERGLDTSLLKELLQGARSGYCVERSLMRSDGEVFPAQLTVSLLRHDNNAGRPEASLLWVIEDISARRSAERETAELMTRLINSERLAAAGRMANTLAHEINNPVEALTNIFYLLQTTELTPQVEELVGIAARELDRVGHITRSTLSFYRGVPGRTLDLEALLKEVVQLFTARISNQSVEILTSYEEGVSQACFDPSLRQVFANIFANALEATGVSGGRIRLRARVRGSVALVTVSDTGHGIEQANLQSIFEAFFTTKVGRGSGLGLWVARGMLQEQGGTLMLRSSTRGPYRGTLIRIALPLPPAAESNCVEPETAGTAQVATRT